MQKQNAKLANAKPSRKPVTKAAKPDAKRAPSAQLGAAAAKQTAAGRSNVAKPDKPTNVSAPAVAPSNVYRTATRDAAGIVAQATNFGELSSRDEAYLAFFGSVARSRAGKASLAELHSAGVARAGEKPTKRFLPAALYAGSAKATDVGAYNRLIKAGLLSANADGTVFTVTKAGSERKAYSQR